MPRKSEQLQFSREGICFTTNTGLTLSPIWFVLFCLLHNSDHSTVPDPDPLTPLTAPGRVPNFPAKMHAILSHPELRDIVCWLPHGRSWRVLKPREFEIKVLPKFFEHAKFSSFVRQANGWGFRRLTQGTFGSGDKAERELSALRHPHLPLFAHHRLLLFS
jgi:hypothetical protein